MIAYVWPDSKWDSTSECDRQPGVNTQYTNTLWITHVFIKPVFGLMCSFWKHCLRLSSKCHLKHIILQIFIFHSSNESLSLINQFTPCFLVSNVSLIKSILLAECFSEQLGRRLVPMMVFSQQPLEEAGDEHMTCRRSWFQSDVSSE